MADAVTRFPFLIGAAILLAAQPGLAAPAPAAGNAAEAAQTQDAVAPKPKAEKATSIPEPDTLALFLLGAAGLVLGRRFSRSKRQRSPEA